VPPAAELDLDWTAPPLVLAAAVAAILLFGQAVLRLRRRGRRDLASWSRCILFAAGLALVVLPLVSPLDELAERYLLSAHMLQHVLLADAGPALLVLAVRGPIALFLLPPPALRAFASLRPLLRLLVRPEAAFAIWLATIVGWHFPTAYEYALRHPWAHDVEHATFLVAGTLAWIQVVDPLGHGRLTRGGRALFACALFAFGTAVGDGLLFSRAPAYETYADQAHRVFGLSPLLDQRLAAAVMFAEQALTVGTALVLLLRPYLRVMGLRPRSG
jgi:cytochrome c oxidase assembly factor CtaG